MGSGAETSDTAVSVSVPHESTGVRIARHAVSDQLDSAGVAQADRADAMLVVSELVSNSVRHAAPLASGGITVRWSVGADVLHLEITDGGAAYAAARRHRCPLRDGGARAWTSSVA